jgi:hypothetical protein
LKIRRQEFAALIDEIAAHEVCWWPVAESYKIAGGWIYPEGGWDLSTPLEDPDLFLSFARLGARGDPSESSVLRWVSRYGLLLREDSQLKAWTGWWELGSGGQEIANQAPMPLDRFRAEVRRAKDLLDLYAQLQARDIKAIEARAANPATTTDERLSSHPERSGLHGEARKVYERLSGRPGYEWDLWVATKVLADELTVSVSGARLRAEVTDSIHGLVFFDEDGRERNFFFKPPYSLGSTWHCPDLLSALYLQFYLLVTEHKPMRRCENPACMMLFPATRKDKRFCNPTCRSNARNYPKP